MTDTSGAKTMSPNKKAVGKSKRQGGTSKKSPKGDFENVAKLLQLDQVVADEVSMLINREKLQGMSGGRLALETGFDSRTIGASKNRVEFRYVLDVIVPDDSESEDEETPPAAILRLVYRASYDVDGSVKLSEDDLTKYRNRLGVFHTFPYIRAHVTDLTTRAGLPPLVLPLMRFGNQEEEVTAED